MPRARPAMREHRHGSSRVRALASALTLAIALALASAGHARAQDAIVVDHTTADIDRIPDAWLERARELTLHYAHTSHGSQIVSGIQRLSGLDDRFAVAVRTGGPVALPEGRNALRIYDGNNPETYITPELYWSRPEGLAKTRSVAATGMFDYSMWSWCGQQSSNSEAVVGQYLDKMRDLEAEFPDMRFILMTGHTDGGSATLARNNDQVRRFALARGMVLFDFADIESYDPSGRHYPDTTDACAWCADWCRDHPETCQDLPGSCAHSHPFNCKRKAEAFWWMMARLAGWPGPDATEPTPTRPAPTATNTATVTATAGATATSVPEPEVLWLPWAGRHGGSGG